MGIANLSPMNTKYFYDSVRASLFAGRISAKQLQGMEAIFVEYARLCVNDLRKLAYILATAYHETAKTMQPIEEYDKGGARPYARKIRMDRKPYTTPNKIYYGRGHVQLTWYENYKNMGKILGLPLLEQPELMLTMEVSIKVLFEGMLNAKSTFGDFTGRSLERYFTKTLTDPLGARYVVNGNDKAELIRDHYNKFYAALTINQA